MERQFLPEGARGKIVNFETIETKRLQREFSRSMDILLSYLKDNVNEDLTAKTARLNPAFRGVEEAAQEVEKKLADKYPDYDYKCGDYYPGELTNYWNSFKGSFESLFSMINFA